jgi:hypothetical protein
LPSLGILRFERPLFAHPSHLIAMNLNPPFPDVWLDITVIFLRQRSDLDPRRAHKNFAKLRRRRRR